MSLIMVSQKHALTSWFSRIVRKCWRTVSRIFGQMNARHAEDGLDWNRNKWTWWKVFVKGTKKGRDRKKRLKEWEADIHLKIKPSFCTLQLCCLFTLFTSNRLFALTSANNALYLDKTFLTKDFINLKIVFEMQGSEVEMEHKFYSIQKREISGKIVLFMIF